jgi:transcription termination factor Rho
MLIAKDHLEALWSIRKTMDDSFDFVDKFMKRMRKTENNEEFFELFESEKKGAPKRVKTVTN